MKPSNNRRSADAYARNNHTSDAAPLTPNKVARLRNHQGLIGLFGLVEHLSRLAYSEHEPIDTDDLYRLLFELSQKGMEKVSEREFLEDALESDFCGSPATSAAKKRNKKRR